MESGSRSGKKGQSFHLQERQEDRISMLPKCTKHTIPSETSTLTIYARTCYCLLFILVELRVQSSTYKLHAAISFLMNHVTYSVLKT